MRSAPLEHFDHTMHVNVRGMYLDDDSAPPGTWPSGAAGRSSAPRRRPRTSARSTGHLQRVEGRGGSARALAGGRSRPARRSSQRSRARLGTTGQRRRSWRTSASGRSTARGSRSIGPPNRRDRGRGPRSSSPTSLVRDRLGRAGRWGPDGRATAASDWEAVPSATAPASSQEPRGERRAYEGKVALVTGAGTGSAGRCASGSPRRAPRSSSPRRRRGTSRRHAARGRGGVRAPSAARPHARPHRAGGGRRGRGAGRRALRPDRRALEQRRHRLPHGPPVTETTDEEWERIFRVNVTGMFWACRAAIPHMPEAARS